MGVCPQFDVLWGELTGVEHLRLYGQVKVGLAGSTWAGGQAGRQPAGGRYFLCVAALASFHGLPSLALKYTPSP